MCDQSLSSDSLTISFSLGLDLGPKGISARFNDRDDRNDRRGDDRHDRRGGDRDRRPYDDYNSGPPRGRRSNSRDRRPAYGGGSGGRSRSRERFAHSTFLSGSHLFLRAPYDRGDRGWGGERRNYDSRDNRGPPPSDRWGGPPRRSRSGSAFPSSSSSHRSVGIEAQPDLPLRMADLTAEVVDKQKERRVGWNEGAVSPSESSAHRISDQTSLSSTCIDFSCRIQCQSVGINLSSLTVAYNSLNNRPVIHQLPPLSLFSSIRTAQSHSLRPETEQSSNSILPFSAHGHTADHLFSRGGKEWRQEEVGQTLFD
jgi:hypothetical protein